MSFDNEQLEFECPECSATVQTTLGEARRSQSVTCPNSHTIEIDGLDLDRATGQVEQALSELDRRIRDINRRN
jgi:hypothetical protein